MAKKKKLNGDGLEPGALVSEADYIRVSLNHRNNKNVKPEIENITEKDGYFLKSD